MGVLSPTIYRCALAHAQYELHITLDGVAVWRCDSAGQCSAGLRTPGSCSSISVTYFLLQICSFLSLWIQRIMSANTGAHFPQDSDTRRASSPPPVCRRCTKHDSCFTGIWPRMETWLGSNLRRRSSTTACCLTLTAWTRRPPSCWQRSRPICPELFSSESCGPESLFGPGNSSRKCWSKDTWLHNRPQVLPQHQSHMGIIKLV